MGISGAHRSRNANDCDCESCAYCERPFGTVLSHEHDHFPVPARWGGETTVPACISCHDLKDRIDLDSWPVEVIGAMWKADPLLRLLIAKMFAAMLDAVNRADKKAAPDYEEPGTATEVGRVPHVELPF